MHRKCPLSGVKRTLVVQIVISADLAFVHFPAIELSNPAHRIASDAFAARIVAALAGFGAGPMGERTRDVQLVAGEVSPDAFDLVLLNVRDTSRAMIYWRTIASARHYADPVTN